MSVVVVTGGTSGIGKALAEISARDGNTVYTLSRSEYSWDDSLMHHIVCDVTKGSDLEHAMKLVEEKEGVIDYLFCCAGYGIAGVTEYTSLEDAKNQFDVNFFGLFSTIKTGLPLLKKSDHPKVVFISSVAAEISIPFQSFYSASKAASGKLLEAWQLELRRFGIQVVSFLLGDTKTDFTARRKKSDVLAKEYQESFKRSISKMEYDEQNGLTAEYVAGIIYRRCRKKNISPVQTIGFQYHVFLALQRMLPRRLVLSLVEKIYAK